MFPKEDGSYATFITQAFANQVDPQGRTDMNFKQEHGLPHNFSEIYNSTPSERRKIIASLRGVLSTTYAHAAVVHQTCEGQYDNARGKPLKYSLRHIK